MAPRRDRPTRSARGSRKFKRQRKSSAGLWTALALCLLLAAFFGVLELARPHVSGDRLRFDTLVDLAERGKLKDAKILDVDSYLVGTYIADVGAPRAYNAPYLKETRERLVDILIQNRVPTTIDQQTSKRLVSLATLVLPGLAIVVLFIYMIISSRRGTGLFAIRSGARRIDAGAGGVTFAEIAGQDGAVEELQEIKQFLSDPDRFRQLGATIPKGVLLYGPPGCGKTMLARALANEAKASFLSISGSDFVELYVGVGASRVRDLFREARESAPAIVFIDELDAVGRARGVVGTVAASGEQEQALNQILAEMDGFSTSDGIIVLGATNRPDVLDAALLRPGRFDRTVGLERPDEQARRSILEVHARSKPLAPDVDFPAIARRAIGLTGADLANVLNEGALLAARSGSPVISQSILDTALRRILEAPERQRRLSLRESSIGRRFSADDRVTFADVAGQEEAVAELKEIRDFLVSPDRYASLGASIPRGVLLYGPPGCGKTMLARALASEANAAFFSVAASEFDEVFVGRGAARVRDLFADARSRPPAIIFIDELDAVGRARSGVAHAAGGSDHSQALNQILAEMDGFSTSDGIIVLGATNRPDVLDQALLRPGRFDRTIGLSLPGEKDRLAILSVHAGKGRVLGPDTDLAAIARAAIGLTGADLANVVNEGALLAARAERHAICQADFEEGLRRMLEAPERQRRLAMRSKSIGRRPVAEERVTFADVAGMDDAVAELAEVRDYLAAPERYAALGARPPRGILLVGPPGCGKTLLARAVAGEANAAFFSASGSEFVEVWVGEGASRVRDLFADARASAPSIVFIDEIDAVGTHRSTVAVGGNREHEQTLNQILIELDGFEARAGVILIAATNRPDMLDSALLRPGRIDRQVEITPPDRAGRRAILDLHAQRVALADDVDLDTVAGLCRGFSGADLANVVNEAALLATRKRLGRVPMSLVEEAIDRATLGVGRSGRLMTDQERRVLAAHEAGHALVALTLPGATPPHKITILPRSHTLGHVRTLDTHDRVMATRSEMIHEMAASLAGKVAEEIFFGESSSGSAADLERVGSIARRMVCELGMSEALGSVPYQDGATGTGQFGRAYSEESARTIDAEVLRLVHEAEQMARKVLTERRPNLELVAGTLLKYETLTAAQLQDLATRRVTRTRPAASAPRPARAAGT